MAITEVLTHIENHIYQYVSKRRPKEWQQKRIEAGMPSPTTGESGADRNGDLRLVVPKLHPEFQLGNRMAKKPNVAT